MTARISLIPGKTRGPRPRLQMRLHKFCNTLLFGEDRNPAVHQGAKRAGHADMTIQREDEVGSGLFDHCPVVRVCCAATTFGTIFGDGMVRIVDAHDVELFVLENAEIEGPAQALRDSALHRLRPRASTD